MGALILFLISGPPHRPVHFPSSPVNGPGTSVSGTIQARARH